MKKHLRLSSQLKEERGVTAIIVGLCMAAFVGFAALAIDIGYALVTRNELQNVADAAALAATRQLGVIYESLSYDAKQNYVCDPTLLISVAKDVASKNKAGGQNISINDADVVIGQWDGVNHILTATLNQPDAVKVTARRDGSANGPITTFFAKIFGIDTLNVSRFATAALTGQSTAPQGGLPFPAGISEQWYNNASSGFCDQPIQFYPTGSSCAGWHTYTTSPSSASTLRAILQGLQNGTFVSPEVITGETQFDFTGGTLTSVFSDMQNLFNAMRVLNDGVLDQDTDSNTWTTSVVVYDRADCSNPGGNTLTIVGLTTVTITQVISTPDKIIMAEVKCNNLESGRGSGGNYGTKGTIPGLVQ